MSLFQLLTISSSHHPTLSPSHLSHYLSLYFTFTPFHHHILLTISPSLFQLLTISPSHHLTLSLFSLSHPFHYLSLSLFHPLTISPFHLFTFLIISSLLLSQPLSILPSHLCNRSPSHPHSHNFNIFLIYLKT